MGQTDRRSSAFYEGDVRKMEMGKNSGMNLETFHRVVYSVCLLILKCFVMARESSLSDTILFIRITENYMILIIFSTNRQSCTKLRLGESLLSI